MDDDSTKNSDTKATGGRALAEALRGRMASISAGGVRSDAEESVVGAHAACDCCGLPICDESHPQFCTYCREGGTRPSHEMPEGAKVGVHRYTGCKQITRKYRRALLADIKAHESGRRRGTARKKRRARGRTA